jgi:hypothetical protein
VGHQLPDGFSRTPKLKQKRSIEACPGIGIEDGIGGGTYWKWKCLQLVMKSTIQLLTRRSFENGGIEKSDRNI